MIREPIRGILRKTRRSGWKQHYAGIKALTTKEEIINFQERCLEKLLVHAYHNVPYYSRIFRDIGTIQKNEKADLSRFNEIPILAKEIIKEHQKELVSKDYITRKWYSSSTGGSTGEPTRFMQENTYTRWSGATFYFCYNDILGVDEPSMKKVIL